MQPSQVDHEVRAALEAADSPDNSPAEKAEMLMEIAMRLQLRPRDPAQLLQAVELYDRALQTCPQKLALLAARIRARRGTALQAIPAQDSQYLQAALEDYDAVSGVFSTLGTAAELAELDMNRGLVLQTLAGFGAVPMQQAISAYQSALRFFERDSHPREYAILHNNLATAFLSLPAASESGKLREALAVQSFEEALRVVTLEAQPVEYAMLQNNLGNALQHADSAHPIENCLRALDAYDESLKVRTRSAMPIEYANTLSNRAACLARIPDSPEHPEQGNPENVQRAIEDYRLAREVFASLGESGRAQLVSQMLEDLESGVEALASQTNTEMDHEQSG